MFLRMNRAFKKSRSEDGFTLIELLVVIVLIGILAAIAIPTFLDHQRAAMNATVKSDARNSVISVATALVTNPKATGFTVLRAGDTPSGTLTASGVPTAVVTIPAGESPAYVVESKNNETVIVSEPDKGNNALSATSRGSWESYVVHAESLVTGYWYEFSSLTGKYTDGTNPSPVGNGGMPGAGGAGGAGGGGTSTSPTYRTQRGANIWNQPVSPYSIAGDYQSLKKSPNGQTLLLSSTFALTDRADFYSSDAGTTFSSYMGGGNGCSDYLSVLLDDGSTLIAGGGTLANDQSGVPQPDTIWKGCTGAMSTGSPTESRLNMSYALPAHHSGDTSGSTLLPSTRNSNHSSVAASDNGTTIAAEGYDWNANGAVNSFLLVSTDGGQTGVKINKPTSWTTIDSLGVWVSGSGSSIAVQVPDGIWISTDGGQTGRTEPLPSATVTNAVDVAFSSDGTHVIIGGGSGKVGISTNSGGSFSWNTLSDVSNGSSVTASNTISQVLVSDDGQRMVALEDNGHGLFISSDAGATWFLDPTGNFSTSQSYAGGSVLAAPHDLSKINILVKNNPASGSYYPYMEQWIWGDKYSDQQVCVTNCPSGGGVSAN